MINTVVKKKKSVSTGRKCITGRNQRYTPVYINTHIPDFSVHLVPSYPFTSDSLPIAQPVHKHAIVIAGWPCDSV